MSIQTAEDDRTTLIAGPLAPDVDAGVVLAQSLADDEPEATEGTGSPPVDPGASGPDPATTLIPGPLAPDVVADVVALSVLSADLVPLSLKSADYSDADDKVALPDVAGGTATGAVPETQELFRIVREVALSHSGDDTYSAVSADEEFEVSGQAAYQQRHFGLGFGIVLFSQESGQLGSVLTLHRTRNADGFAAVFGADAPALLDVTNRADAAGRLAEVGGEVLWSPRWLDRFRAAGAQPESQAAQNEQAIEHQLRPLLGPAVALGLATDRTLAMAYDVVVVRGMGAGLRWLVDASGLLRSPAHRDAALRSVGMASLDAFQTSIGLPPTASPDPMTLARLVGALRATGAADLPGPDELGDRLLAAATGADRLRLQRLAGSTTFTDARYRAS